MPASTHVLTLPGPMLKRGFWLYVWRVEAPQGELLYVGRTGDNSSPHATAPYTRMGQHLGRVKAQNALRRHLETRRIAPEDCASFQMVSHGPLYDEVVGGTGMTRAELMKAHMPMRNRVGALEKALAEALTEAGYDVLNSVRCGWELELETWAIVRAAFAVHFPKLAERAAA